MRRSMSFSKKLSMLHLHLGWWMYAYNMDISVIISTTKYRYNKCSRSSLFGIFMVSEGFRNVKVDMYSYVGIIGWI